MVPVLTILLLVVNLFKEIIQLITEGLDYFLNYENVIDLVVIVLVTICQYYYFFGKGKTEKGYYFPEEESHFIDFLLPTTLMLHLNLIL